MTTNNTPETLRADAAHAEQMAADSFDRCDTDGFLSQWAHGMTARKKRAEADLIEAGGVIEIAALFNAHDGSVASTHYAYGQWGPFWVLNDEATDRFGKRFFKPSQARKAATRVRNNAAKGFTLGTIKVRGYVTIAGGGTGLSGAANAYVTTLPVIDDLKSGTYTIVSASNDDTDD